MNLTANKLKAQIELIRNQAAVFLIDTAMHKKRIGEIYDHGTEKPLYAEAVEIACRLITRSGSESKNIAAQAREIYQSTFTDLYRMQIPYDSDVTEGDQMIYTDKVTGDIRTFDVLFAPAKHEYSAAVVIQLQEVK